MDVHLKSLVLNALKIGKKFSIRSAK